MCVAITMAPGGVLTLAEVERMNRANADGVGVAWARAGVVHWYKTTKVDPEYITGMVAAWKDYPRLVHFRYATAGGTRPDLCHPFEIGPLANCSPVGKASRVMIHNGHWSRWSEVRDLLSKEGLLPDEGPWSDTRLAAFLSHNDPDWLIALGGKVAVMSGEGAIHRIGDWAALREGIHVSNNSWAAQAEYRRGGYTGFRSWRGWGWSDDEFEAFFAEQEAEKEAELAALIKEEEEKEASARAKEQARNEKRARRGNRRNRGTIQQAGTPVNGDTPPDGPNATAEISLNDIGGDSCRLADPAAKAIKFDPEPWQNPATGKWYKWCNTRGRNEVVEIAPPSPQGPVG